MVTCGKVESSAFILRYKYVLDEKTRRSNVLNTNLFSRWSHFEKRATNETGIISKAKLAMLKKVQRFYGRLTLEAALYKGDVLA